MSDTSVTQNEQRQGLNRRHVMIGAGVLAAQGLAVVACRQFAAKTPLADVFVGKAESYKADLKRVVSDGLKELKLGPDWVRGRSVLLKPNLVEPDRQSPHINTHPEIIRATADVFRSWGASEVFVAEGQGHCRDTDYVLEQSGLGPVLDESRLSFVDLNHDDVMSVRNTFGSTRMKNLYLPESLKRADIVVSMAKLKTHHWAGVTLSMKNLFGMMPGVAYGWPKNVLHHAGITGSILDINAAVKPHLAIIDGIVGMEGDGPIMGTPRNGGVVIMGTNLPAVDATATRLMGIDPYEIEHLALAARSMGPISETLITQRGEVVASLVQKFARLDPRKPSHLASNVPTKL